MSKRIALFTQCWGSHIGLLKKYLLPSMMQSGNIPKLLEDGYQVDWYIYSPENTGLEGSMFHHIHNTSPDVNYGLVDFIANNLDAICITMMADFFIGNHTIYNGIKMIENKADHCLAVPHARISWEKIGNRVIGDKTNSELVAFAFDNAHKCLIEAEDCRNPNLTWTGLSWRKIDEHNYAVIHNLPTPFICQFKAGDSDLFNKHNWGQFDRGFTQKLKNEGRIKVCGSSDLCFFVEFTPDKHSPVLREGLINNDTAQFEEAGSDYFNEVILNWRR